jgi:hypothetical protein
VSLINEALRKARREAAVDAGEVRRATAPSTLRRGPRIPWVPVAVLGGLILAAVVGASVTWMVVGRDGGVSSQPITRAVEASVESRPEGRSNPPVASTVEADGQEEEDNEATPPEVENAAPAAPVRPMPDAPSSASTPEPPIAAARTRPAAIGPAGEQIWDVVARRDDVTLTLGYLVHRSVDPFAEINGQEVRVGAQVSGCAVTAMDRVSVTLRCGDDTVVLRAK